MSAALCTFELDGLLLAVPVDEVQEVVRVQGLTPVPRAHPVVRGLVNLRGQLIAAVDLRRRLGLPPASGPQAMTIVVRSPDGPASLLVDDVGDVLEPGAAPEPPPETLAPRVRALLRGVHALRDRLLLVLDTARALELEP
ncbi:MAG: chemotaxis protein CheW [Planctomycetes bacterium]|nr:chemotaxis protein CheW [Planctomycetota bacterium]